MSSEALYEKYKDALKRGHVAALRGHVDEALIAYAEAARIAPERSTPHSSAGTALLRRKRPGDALRHYEVALKIAPRDEAALLGRAQSLAGLDRRGEAADAFDALAEVQAANGRLADAVDAARRGLELAEGRERRRTLERLIAKLRASEPGEPGRVALERALQVLDGVAVPQRPAVASRPAPTPKPVNLDALEAAAVAEAVDHHDGLAEGEVAASDGDEADAGVEAATTVDAVPAAAADVTSAAPALGPDSAAESEPEAAAAEPEAAAAEPEAETVSAAEPEAETASDAEPGVEAGTEPAAVVPESAADDESGAPEVVGEVAAGAEGAGEPAGVEAAVEEPEPALSSLAAGSGAPAEPAEPAEPEIEPTLPAAREIPEGATAAEFEARAEAAAEAGVPSRAVDALLDLAALHARDGRIDAALDACYSAVTFDPDNIALHLALAELYGGRGWTQLMVEKLDLVERIGRLDGDQSVLADVAGVRAALT